MFLGFLCSASARTLVNAAKPAADAFRHPMSTAATDLSAPAAAAGVSGVATTTETGGTAPKSFIPGGKCAILASVRLSGRHRPVGAISCHRWLCVCVCDRCAARVVSVANNWLDQCMYDFGRMSLFCVVLIVFVMSVFLRSNVGPFLFESRRRSWPCASKRSVPNRQSPHACRRLQARIATHDE